MAGTGKPKTVLPPLACDCHAHVIGPASRYPFSLARVYTPPDCLPEDYGQLLATLGIQRAVLVQPSIYGSDNRLLLDALHRDPGRYRGVAVAQDDVTLQELRLWHAAGVRGLRVNLVDRHDKQGKLPLDLLNRLGERIAPLGWHLELLMHVDQHADELGALAELPTPVSLGHFGYQSLGMGADSDGFAALLDVLRSNRIWVKLTGPYRLTASPLPYAECDSLALTLREAAPHRLLWGSDWPHVMLKGRMPDDAELVDLIPRWLPDARLQRQVLVDNPQAFYDFGDEESAP
jgi:predicted TIM-barrel fold metal-dependent hydrolase